MGNISLAHSDFSEFEAQFSSTAPIAPTREQLRARGWLIVLVASAALWAGIGVGIAAAIHALS